MIALRDLILKDDRLTGGLDDAEARMLIEWLVERTEGWAANAMEVQRLCRRARAIAHFVTLWCHEAQFGSALQLAASERFAWPLPTAPMDATDLMQAILDWESHRGR